MKKIKRLLIGIMAALLITTAVPETIPLLSQQTEVQAASYKLNKTKLTLIKGQSYQLKLNGYNKTIKWSSSKNSVVSVAKNGKITAKAKGAAIITAYAGSKKYLCKVVVETPKLSAANMNIYVGAKKTLKISGTTQKVVWVSSNKNIATVNGQGVIVGKKAGTVNIIAVVNNRKFGCKVVVKKKSTSGKPSYPVSSYVWIPRTGSKYHRTSSCSHMKNPRYVALSDVIARGYGKCSKCW